jgi:hypothetical protein
MAKDRNIILQTFDTHEQADEANIAFYRALSPDEKLDIGLELMKATYEGNPRLERVYPSC